MTLAGEGALGPDGQVDNPQNFSYDSIGNHLTNDETYNILNQGSGKTYDANGNMTRNGSNWIALYDGENRLRTVSHPYDGVELLYDYAGRIYQVNDFYMDGGLPPTSTLNYRRIYDGTKLIATVRNGEIEDTFVWQPETSGDADVILWDNSYVYATDPNKNVRVKRFPNDWIPGTWVEEFIDYKPFGELKNYVADPPRFMFSSEEYMPETGMYHYLYRAYSPSLARFITRDPIEEQGGVNLYCFVNNNPVNYWDVAGKAPKNNSNTANRIKKNAIASAKRCINIFVDKEKLKEKFNDDVQEKLIEFITGCYAGIEIDFNTISNAITDVIAGDTLRNIICCFIANAVGTVDNPCQENHKNRNKVACEQCCDFEYCKLSLTSPGGKAPERTKTSCYLKCCSSSI